MKSARTTTIVIIMSLAALLFSGCAGMGVREEAPVPPEEAVPEPEVPAYEGISSLLAAGRPEAALEAFERAWAEDPDSFRTALLRAGLLVSLGRTGEAEESLRAALAIEPGNSDALFTGALIAGLEGDEEKERELLEEVLEAEPEHGRALAALGELHLRDKEYEKAEEAFSRSIAAEPDNIVARAGYGNLLLRQKKFEESVEQLDEAVQMFPEYPFAWADLGKAKSGLGRNAEAIEDLGRAIELDPGHYWHYIDRGTLYLYDGELKAAEADFLAARGLDPAYFLSYVYLAGIYKDTGRWESALENYKAVLERRADYYHAWEGAAETAFYCRDYPYAADMYLKSYQRYPEEHGYALMHAVSLLEAGKERECRSYLQSVMGSFPRETYLYDVARTFTERGYDNYLSSKLNREKQIPLRVRAYFYLGLYYRHAGNDALAARYLSEVKEAGLFGMFETDMAENLLENEGAF